MGTPGWPPGSHGAVSSIPGYTCVAMSEGDRHLFDRIIDLIRAAGWRDEGAVGPFCVFHKAGEPLPVIVPAPPATGGNGEVGTNEKRTPLHSGEDPADRIFELAVETGVPDLAEQHDHYVYGTPKRTS